LTVHDLCGEWVYVGDQSVCCAVRHR
jgi:hypothetical protein